MRALVVDDEPPARRRLARMLRALPAVDLVSEIEDAEALLAWLDETPADVVFLDIRMPGLDGLALAQRYPDLPPIVFVTAYDSYAVRAFEVDAIDYLVKPVRPERLAAAVERVHTRVLGPRRVRPEKVGRGHAARVTSVSRGAIEVFDPAGITRFWASQKYTMFLADGVERLTEESLSTLEARLTGHGFLRVHRAELVRVDALRALQAGPEGHEALLSDGQRARVSRRCLGQLKEALARLTGSAL